MEITLAPEFQEFVEKQVKAGAFPSAQQVIEAGLLRLLEDESGNFEPGEWNSLIQHAEQQFARGEGHTLEHVRQHFDLKSFGR